MQLQARNSNFRDQERIASCVFALASAPVVKRNIGSTARAARDFRGPSGKNFAGAVLAAFVWVEYFTLEIKYYLLTAESCHCRRSNKLWPSWRCYICCREAEGGYVLGSDEPPKCALSSKESVTLEHLAHLIATELCTSPFKFCWYIWLSVGRYQFFDKWQHSGYDLKIALILITGSISGFNSSWITAQIWSILSYVWIYELSTFCSVGGSNREVTDNID